MWTLTATTATATAMTAANAAAVGVEVSYAVDADVAGRHSGASTIAKCTNAGTTGMHLT